MPSSASETADSAMAKSPIRARSLAVALQNLATLNCLSNEHLTQQNRKWDGACALSVLLAEIRGNSGGTTLRGNNIVCFETHHVNDLLKTTAVK